MLEDETGGHGLSLRLEYVPEALTERSLLQAIQARATNPAQEVSDKQVVQPLVQLLVYFYLVPQRHVLLPRLL